MEPANPHHLPRLRHGRHVRLPRSPRQHHFQGRQQHEGHMHADVVAAVRLNNVQELENLAKAIKETVKKYKDREP